MPAPVGHTAAVLALLPTDECVPWPGKLGPDGYGQHRMIWKALGRHHPGRGWDLDHLCRNRSCVNPAHLELISHRENVLRGNTIMAAKVAQTHCKHGHPLSGDNLYIRPTGRRECRACRRDGLARFYAKYPERKIPRRRKPSDMDS